MDNNIFIDEASVASP